MSEEIWIAQTDTETLFFVGVRRAVEAGHIDAETEQALAKLLAANEGQDLKVIDGRQASDLMHTHSFSEIT